MRGSSTAAPKFNPNEDAGDDDSDDQYDTPNLGDGS